MKILGIGNAIVDVICKVDDKFITQNNWVEIDRLNYCIYEYKNNLIKIYIKLINIFILKVVDRHNKIYLYK